MIGITLIAACAFRNGADVSLMSAAHGGSANVGRLRFQRLTRPAERDTMRALRSMGSGRFALVPSFTIWSCGAERPPSAD